MARSQRIGEQPALLQAGRLAQMAPNGGPAEPKRLPARATGCQNKAHRLVGSGARRSKSATKVASAPHKQPLPSAGQSRFRSGIVIQKGSQAARRRHVAPSRGYDYSFFHKTDAITRQNDSAEVDLSIILETGS
jgi:hypothetical protein